MKLRNDCPFESVMDMLSGKWKGVILFRLMQGTMRFNELKSSIESISPGVLIQQLRSLEKDKLIARKVYAEVPSKVEYSLTKRGKSLKPVLLQIKNWSKEI